MLAPVGDREVEAVRVRGLHRAIEPDPVQPADERRDGLAANCFVDAELFEHSQLHRDGRAAAPGGRRDQLRDLRRDDGALAADKARWIAALLGTDKVS